MSSVGRNAAPSPPSTLASSARKSSGRRQHATLSAHAATTDNDADAELSTSATSSGTLGDHEKYWSVRSVYVAPHPPSGSHCVLQNDLLCTFGGLQKECESLLFKITTREAALLPSNFLIYSRACQRLQVAPCPTLLDQLSTTPGRYTHAVLDVAGWPLNKAAAEALVCVLDANRAIISSINLRGCGLRDEAWFVISDAIARSPMIRLTKLELSCNTLQNAKDGEALINVVRSAPALQRVGLLKNRLPKAVMQAISEILHSRTRSARAAYGAATARCIDTPVRNRSKLGTSPLRRSTSRSPVSPENLSPSPTIGTFVAKPPTTPRRERTDRTRSALHLSSATPSRSLDFDLDATPSFDIRTDAELSLVATQSGSATHDESAVMQGDRRSEVGNGKSFAVRGMVGSSSSLRRSPTMSSLPEGTAESRYTILPAPPSYREGDPVKLPKLERRDFFRAISMYRDIMTKQTALLETHVLHEAQPAIFEVFRRQTSAIANIDFVTLPRYLCACFPQLSPMQIMHALSFYSEYSLTAPLRAVARDGVLHDQREQIRKIFDCLDTGKRGVLPTSVLHSVRATPVEVEETEEMLRRLQIRELNFDAFATIMAPYLYEQQRRRRRLR